MPLLTAAILTIPTTIIEESHLRAPWPTVATYANWVIWAIFFAEVVIMLTVVPSRRRWLRTHMTCSFSSAISRSGSRSSNPAVERPRASSRS